MGLSVSPPKASQRRQNKKTKQHVEMAPVEAGFGLVIREMLESGNFIVPTQKGAIYSDKPPLYFWLSIGLAQWDLWS
jgi:hypothetical protein